MELEEYAQYRETKVHGRAGFDYNTYICTIPLDFARVRPHWHDAMEIIYIKKGSGCVTVNLHSYPVAAGSIVLVAPGRLHAIDGAPGGRMEYENIIFSLDILDTPQGDWCQENVLRPLRDGRLDIPVCLAPGAPLHEAAAHALDAADAACGTAGPGYSLLVKSQLYQLLYLLYHAAGSAPAARADSNAARLKTVLSYVGEHYAEPITVAQAARAAHYSPAHFMRFFHAGTGQSFIEYLTEHRLAAAARALQETDAAVSEIAQSCGFASASYFCRRFREKYGTSPRDYRSGR
ncbi:MAG: AraC family transcriptional regulator [Faecalibacterium sp.]|nr:AraC family transcriptional regulator [Faecalibacterium sp.]